MAPRARDPLKAKEAQRKKLLLLLVPVLAIAVAIQGPRLMNALSGGEKDEEATPAGVTDEGTSTTEENSGDGDSGASGTPAVPAIPDLSSLGLAVALRDSDIPPPADEGQLISFGRFVGKDPFNQLVEVETPDEEEAESTPSGDPEPAPDDGEDGDTIDVPAPDTAELMVNDLPEFVPVGGSFPIADPLFTLVAVSEDTIHIGLVDGAFSTGVPTVDLTVGETLTLVSQPDGIRYRIKLVSLSAGGAE